MRKVCKVRRSAGYSSSAIGGTYNATRTPLADLSATPAQLGREVLDIAASHIKPGITTLELDRIVHEECVKRDAYPSPLGYHKFPRSVCTSVNEVICHGEPPRAFRSSINSFCCSCSSSAGIPDARPLENGDIINLDVSLFHDGYHSDLNATCANSNEAAQISS